MADKLNDGDDGGKPGDDDTAAMLTVLRLLKDDDSDAAVVARIALVVFAGKWGATVSGYQLGTGVLHADTPGIDRRMTNARAVLLNTERETEGLRVRVIELVGLARKLDTTAFPENSEAAATPFPRALMLGAFLSDLHERFKVFFDAQKDPFRMKLESELNKQYPSDVTIAADLAKRSGVESGNVLESYRKAAARFAK